MNRGILDKVILFDSSVATLNKGDEIIMNAIEKELSFVLKNKFVIRGTTHVPMILESQSNMENHIIKEYEKAKYKFICGTNLLWRNMNYEWPSFNVNLKIVKPYKNSILLGVGSGKYRHDPDEYTIELYNSILSHDKIHSVRDEYTKKFLNEMGFKAINTGCPTLWGFTEEKCRKIKTKKSNNVIFTLTDYNKQPDIDEKWIKILLGNYQTTYFWPQGAGDYEYLKNFDSCKDVIIIQPDLQSYSKILENDDLDYIGTRLHGGIYALQHNKRSIILSVDKRMELISEDFGLITIDREKENFECDLKEKIYEEINTDIHINKENIVEWLEQFD